MAVSGESAEGRARTSLVIAAGARGRGGAVAGPGRRVVGGVFLVLGWLVFVYALHSFGRAGSESE